MQGVVDALGGELFVHAGPLLSRLVGALALLFVAWRLAITARHWFERVTAITSADVNLRVLLGRFLYLGVLCAGLLWALEVFGISPATVVTVLGVLGLAASLALQDILKNFCAGVYLLFERPFRIGDEIGLRDFRGHVVDVGIRTTSIRTAENLQVMIPNAIVLSEIVVNRSYYGSRPEESRATLTPER